MNERMQQIERRLKETFVQSEIQLKDQSHLHAGHAGAADGRGHYALTIISDHFAGSSRLQRHQMVYDALRDLLETDIHAIRIRALTESER